MPEGIAAFELPDGQRVFAPAGADPEAVRRCVADGQLAVKYRCYLLASNGWK